MVDINNVLPVNVNKFLSIDRFITQEEYCALTNSNLETLTSSILKNLNCNNGNHNWIKVKNSTDVVCTICDKRAMGSYIK